MPASD
jgi:hypothetical protein